MQPEPVQDVPLIILFEKVILGVEFEQKGKNPFTEPPVAVAFPKLSVFLVIKEAAPKLFVAIALAMHEVPEQVPMVIVFDSMFAKPIPVELM